MLRTIVHRTLDGAEAELVSDSAAVMAQVDLKVKDFSSDACGWTRNHCARIMSRTELPGDISAEFEPRNLSV